MKNPSERLAFALDFPTLAQAEPFITSLSGSVGTFKVGLELFTAEGPAAVDRVIEADRQCFLDLKLHDIPATVSNAARAASKLGTRYLTMHASAGPQCLEAAARALQGTTTTLLAITVLTSLEEDALRRIGINHDPKELALRLGELAIDSGVRGLVCSVHECAIMRERFGKGVTLVTPGIRLAGTDPNDQRRVATPSDAIRAGSDLLVVGRPIRDAKDPAAVAKAILKEIADADAS